MSVTEDHVSIAKKLLKKHGGLSVPLLQSKLKVTYAYAKKLMDSVFKNAISKKRVKSKDKMSSYELKAHQRLAEVEVANTILNLHARLQREGKGAKDHLDQIIFELELIAKKPIVPVAQLEDD